MAEADGPRQTLAPGTVLVGRYRIERRLGAGGVGEVWAGKNLAVGTDVAIKTLAIAAADDVEMVMRFRREANLLSRLQSDHVARVLDFATDEQQGLFLVMDLIRGEPVSEVIKQRRMSVEEAIDLAVDVLRGMIDLHAANVVHRDLKPGNVILGPGSGGRTKAVIVDFGFGKVMTAPDHEGSGITRADMAVGTLEYMAPEQVINSKHVTPAADQYSLGAMLFRAVAGHHMFGDAKGVQLAQVKLGTLPPRLATGRQDPVGRGFEEVVLRAVRRRPEERFANDREMLDALTNLQQLAHAAAQRPAPQPAPPAANQSAGGASPWGTRPPAPIVEAPARAPRRSVARVVGVAVAIAIVAGTAIGYVAFRLTAP